MLDAFVYDIDSLRGYRSFVKINMIKIK